MDPPIPVDLRSLLHMLQSTNYYNSIGLDMDPVFLPRKHVAATIKIVGRILIHMLLELTTSFLSIF